MRPSFGKKKTNKTGSFHRTLLLFFVPLFLFATLEQSQAEPAYHLVGIVKGKDFMGAVLDDGKSGQTLYRLREQLPDGSSISRILQNSITIRQSDGVSYELFIVQGAKPSTAKAPPPVSRPNTSAGRSYQPPLDRAAPAIRAREPGQDGSLERKRKRRIPRNRRLRSGR